MVDSAEIPQEYKFSNHEFRSVNAKEKGGHSFVLRAFQSKAINDIRTSIVAKDLLGILKQSKTAIELMETSVYEFNMDKQFLLHITREEAPEEEKEEEVEVLVEDEVAVEAEAETETEAKTETEEEAETEEEVAIEPEKAEAEKEAETEKQS